MIHFKIKDSFDRKNIFGEMHWRLKFLLFWVILFFLIIFRTNAQPGSGNAIDFDGSDDYVDIGNPLGPSDLQDISFSYEAWVNLDDLATKQTITGNTNYSGSYGTGLDIFNNEARFFKEEEAVMVTGAINSGWHHIAGTYDMTTDILTLYIDGVSVGTPVTSAQTDIGGSHRLGLSANASTAPTYINGRIDEVRIWSVARSVTEIRENMCQKLTGNETDLAGYWRLDEGTGSTTSDASGNGNNGTLQGPSSAPQWQTSGAPIGDISEFDHVNGNSINLTATHADGSYFNFEDISGNPDGVHLYLVNEAPNATTVPSSFSSLETTRYYGIFTTGGTDVTGTVTYNYTGNTNINGQASEAESRIAKREDNAYTSWDPISFTINTDVSENLIKIFNQSNGEFIGGFSNSSLGTLPGSGTSLNFNEVGGGQLEYVSIPDNDAYDFGTDDFTVEFWFKSGTNPAAGSADFFINKYSSGFNNGWTILVEDNSPEPGRIGLFTNNGVSGEYGLVYTQAVMTDDNWHHIACFRSGDNLDIYVDGISGVSEADVGRNTGKDDDDFSNNLPLGIAARLQPSSSDYTVCQLDEIRIWKTALSLTEIRGWMTRKINLDHPQIDKLTGYFRFDQGAGNTTITNWVDESTGSIVNLDVNNDWVTSGTPLGDESIYSYGNGSSTDLLLTHSDGSSFNFTNFSNDIDGALMYLVNEAPNITTVPSGFSSLETSRYVGLFTVGGTDGATLTYNYSGNTAISGASDPSSARFVYRDDNADQSWAQTSYQINTDVSSNSIKIPDQQTGEYLVGFSNATSLSTPPGSGYALDFDGVDEYIEIPDESKFDFGTGDFTVEFWFKSDPEPVSSSDFILAKYQSGSQNGWNILVRPTSGNIQFQVKNGSNTILVESDNSATDNQWHHATGVRNGDNIYLYIDGVGASSNPVSGVSTYNVDNDRQIGIGARISSGGANSFFEGSTDEVRIWNTALTQGEIQSWMNRKVTPSHPQFDNLVGYFRLDEGTGSTTSNWVDESTKSLNNMEPSDWVVSGAPVGNEISSLFNPSGIPTSSSVNISPTDKGLMTATVAGGSPTGIIIYYVSESPNVTTVPSGLTSFDDGYFGVKVFGGTSPTYDITYDYTNNANVDDINDPRLATRADNSVTTWTDLGATLNTTNNTLTFTGLSGTEFIPGGGDGGAPLPVSWLNFNAKVVIDAAELVWRTGQEINNDYFVIERSKDGVKYQAIGQLKGKGNTNKVSTYTFIDFHPVIGTNYYRIKQVDFDGQFDFSDTKHIRFEPDNSVSISPNPVNGSMKIEGIFNVESGVLVQIIDMAGQIIQSQIINVEGGILKMPLSLNIKAGVYAVNITSSNFQINKKIIVNR